MSFFVRSVRLRVPLVLGFVFWPFADPASTGKMNTNFLPLVDQTIIIPDVGSTGQFVDLELPFGPTIGAGDWYIGYQLPQTNNSVTFVGDADGIQHNAGFISVGGTSAYRSGDDGEFSGGKC